MARVLKLRRRSDSARVAGWVCVVAFAWLGSAAVLQAEAPGVHYNHAGIMPPGAIGSQQLQRGGPLPGYFQPVEIKAPPGVLISTATDGDFDAPEVERLVAGMLIGSVYRLRIANIQFHEGLEVFPTIEVIDRLYPPANHEFRFPIPIELTQEELVMALDGKFIERVIYLEDPDNAVPAAEQPNQQSYFEAAEGANPLEVADSLGRPMAILRLGGRVPGAEGIDSAFMFGCPPLLRWKPSAGHASVRVLSPDGEGTIIRQTSATSVVAEKSLPLKRTALEATPSSSAKSARGSKASKATLPKPWDSAVRRSWTRGTAAR